MTRDRVSNVGKLKETASKDRAKHNATRGLQTIPASIKAYQALSVLHYRICVAILGLTTWAYGQRIHDFVEELKGAEVSPATVYLALQRMEARGIVVAQEQLSPDGTARSVRVFQLTDRGHELFNLSRDYYKEHPDLLKADGSQRRKLHRVD